jgi:hypothetical protein
VAVAVLVPLVDVALGRAGSAQRLEDPRSSPLVCEGVVLEPDGTPAAGAIVVTSAGGKAVTDGDGHYRLQTRVPVDARTIRVSAVGRRGRSVMASTSIGLPGTGFTRVGPLRLDPGSPCQPGWLPTFGQEPGVNNTVRALEVFDDGSGSTLYAGGAFLTAGGITAKHIARWDGSSWSVLDDETQGIQGGAIVNALKVFDDGDGPALIVGGSFSFAGGAPASRIASWDGHTWTTLGSGTNGAVRALAVFDDGSGPALYAGGEFTTAGGVGTDFIARWDGSSWAALGSGTNGSVLALTVYDDGSGAALYAGGSFTSAGGVAASRIGRWDGSSWSTVGSGVGGNSPDIHALTVFDDGSGPALIAGGSFTFSGGHVTEGIARWDGSNWSALGGLYSDVLALTVFDDGSGPALYAGGQFYYSSDGAVWSIAKWSGSNWTALGSGMGTATVFALKAHDDGSGPALFAAGDFLTSGGVPTHRVAKWNGSDWSALGPGLDAAVTAMTLFDEGGGPALYAAGAFTGSRGVARWDGSNWTALGGGNGSTAYALAAFDDGSGPALHAGSSVGLSKWNGATWTSVGGASLYVYALAVFDDGSGPALYAGGRFQTPGAPESKTFARWNGTSWTNLGTGRGGFVHAFSSFDDGNGTALYAAGAFNATLFGPDVYVAKWNGSTWTDVASGTNGFVRALTVFDDGSGPALYAGGDFTAAGGTPAEWIARWNGSSWTALPGDALNGSVHSLAVFDDGSGPALYAGGVFTVAGGEAASHVARWDGSSWTALGSGTSASVDVITVVVGGAGPVLYAGGSFTTVHESGDSYLALWGCDATPPTLSCPVSVVVTDALADSSGETVSFVVEAEDDHDPSPTVVCVPSSGSSFPPGNSLVTCTATDAAGNQSTCQFQVTVQVKPQLRRR